MMSDLREIFLFPLAAAIILALTILILCAALGGGAAVAVWLFEMVIDALRGLG